MVVEREWKRLAASAGLDEFRGPELMASLADLLCLGLLSTGLQPAQMLGPKARHVIAWAVASPTSAGPGKPFPQISQAL